MVLGNRGVLAQNSAVRTEQETLLDLVRRESVRDLFQNKKIAQMWPVVREQYC